MTKIIVGLAKLVLFSGGVTDGSMGNVDAGWSLGGCLGKGLGEKLSHGRGDFFDVGLEGEVSCIEELDGGVGVVARKGLGAGRDEEGVVLAPDGEQRRLGLAEVLLEGWVELYVVGVVEDEV
jgi:hypothetical protein